ncbi:unnamed protein product [Ceratitis capitata]|uniref:(Mediterranean fruit fly) hypothetical protein n=1 Tax=Ceratitis capitata TaxID=7213 RepID=A0A811UCJ8_CERCA|nr:unnamed protein product [Ceratitis capitata]
MERLPSLSINRGESSGYRLSSLVLTVSTALTERSIRFLVDSLTATEAISQTDEEGNENADELTRTGAAGAVATIGPS